MRPKTEFRFHNAALSLARFDGVGRPIQNPALSLAQFSKPNSDICDLRGQPALDHLARPAGDDVDVAQAGGQRVVVAAEAVRL